MRIQLYCLHLITATISRLATLNTSVRATRPASGYQRFSPDRGSTAAGQIDELVSLIDLPPTLLDAAGIPVPAHMVGRSILALDPRRNE